MSKDDAGRREFLQRGLRSVLRSLSDLTDGDRDGGEERAIVRTVLRPPGALAEREFLDTCYRCGMCVEVCPADAIRRLPSDDEALVNTPFIDPDLAACTVCETIACARDCPSRALAPPASTRDIRIGLAKWFPQLCLRESDAATSAERGEDTDAACTACVDVCPFGTDAIRIDDAGAIEVDADGCVGCGMCQHACPTRPRAIHVRPVDGASANPRG